MTRKGAAQTIDRTCGTDGFTLLEVLVAFAVMATLLSVMYRGVVQMRAGSAAFDDHTQREIVARAVLEEALAQRDMKPGTYHGVRDGRPWTLVAKTVDLKAQLPPPAVDARDQNAAAGQPAPAAQPAPAGQLAPTGQPALAGQPTPTGQPAPPAGQQEKPAWKTQRLLVKVGTEGRQLAIETLRMVRAE